MKTSVTVLFCSVLMLTSLISCNSYEPSNHVRNARHHDQIGSVSSIDVIAVESRSGGGAVLGAVLGGVIGHQMGSGRGRDVATGAGAIGGAVAGNQIERRNKKDDEIYRVTVRYDNGRTQQFDYRDIGDLSVGDRVKVEHGQVYQL